VVVTLEFLFYFEVHALEIHHVYFKILGLETPFAFTHCFTQIWFPVERVIVLAQLDLLLSQLLVLIEVFLDRLDFYHFVVFQQRKSYHIAQWLHNNCLSVWQNNPEKDVFVFVFEIGRVKYKFVEDHVVIHLGFGEQPLVRRGNQLLIYVDFDGHFSRMFGQNAEELVIFEFEYYVRVVVLLLQFILVVDSDAVSVKVYLLQVYVLQCTLTAAHSVELEHQGILFADEVFDLPLLHEIIVHTAFD